MRKTLCGLNCDDCALRESCRGCRETEGRPFGEKCMIAEYCEKGKGAFEQFRQRAMDAFNALRIQDLPKITELYALRGSYINLEYSLPGGQKCRFLHDDKIYLGNQVESQGGGKRYGVAADEKYLLVSQYASDGADAEVVVFKRWQAE